MNDIDQKIQAALRGQTGGDALLAEPNLAEEVIVAFRGHHRWMSGVFLVVSLVLLAVLVWAVNQFLGAGNLSAKLHWGALAFVCLQVVSLLKVWFWMEMHSNRVLRELKRVELLLVTRPPQQ